MARIFTARYLLPINKPPVEYGALLVDNDLILEVDKFEALAAAHPEAAVIDFGDTVLLPPMVNAHTHLELSSFAHWAAVAGEPEPPGSFVDWILWLIRVRRVVSSLQIKNSLVEGLEASLLA